MAVARALCLECRQVSMRVQGQETYLREDPSDFLNLFHMRNKGVTSRLFTFFFIVMKNFSRQMAVVFLPSLHPLAMAHIFLLTKMHWVLAVC